MVGSDYLFAAVGGFGGQSDQVGAVGVFRRDRGHGAWRHVLADHEAYTVFPHPGDPAIVLAGTKDGIWRSTDHGATFSQVTGPDAPQIWSFLADSRDGARILAGTSPIGVMRSEDFGATWKTLPSPGMPEHCSGPFANRVMRLSQHPGRPEEIVAALEINGVMHSSDGGLTWHDRSADLLRQSAEPHLTSAIVTDNPSEGMLDYHAVAIAPSRPDDIVIAGRMGLFRSTDQGTHWRDMEVGRFSPTTYGRDVKASAHDPATLYAALSVAARSEDGGVYRSRDAGETWQRFDKVQVSGTVMSVTEHPRDPARVYLASRNNGEVFGTEDDGATWTDMPLPGPVLSIYALACG